MCVGVLSQMCRFGSPKTRQKGTKIDKKHYTPECNTKVLRNAPNKYKLSPKEVQREPKEQPMNPKGPHHGPKACQLAPKVGQMGSQGHQFEANLAAVNVSIKTRGASFLIETSRVPPLATFGCQRIPPKQSSGAQIVVVVVVVVRRKGVLL